MKGYIYFWGEFYGYLWFRGTKNEIAETLHGSIKMYSLLKQLQTNDFI